MYDKYSKRRDELGLTDYQVAKITGISRSMFSDWKRGKSKPKADKLKLISKVLKVKIEDIC